LEGELDNTTPGKVTGWMRFAGMKEKVTFDLKGNFHRDIRGAKIRFRGDGNHDDPEAAGHMDGFAYHQTGKAGDFTAGLPPHDYGHRPHLEWYSEENGRVVLEPEPEQIQVIGRPIPACESDPISREEQRQNLADFIAVLSEALHAPAVAIGSDKAITSDPEYTHWVLEDARIVGEAKHVKPVSADRCFAYIRLFGMSENAEYGYIEAGNLRSKGDTSFA
jgi:hypothetical protein